MEIQTNSPRYAQTTFKGYSAKPLTGLLLRYTTTLPKHFEKVAVQLEQIGKKQGFDVFVQGHNSIISNNMNTLSAQIIPFKGESEYTWVQDNIAFINGNMFANSNVVNCFNDRISKYFGIPFNLNKKHIAGGNYFTIDNNGKKEILLGVFDKKNLVKLCEQTGINSIKLISQADFHLDLFIRPLRDNVVLVADDKILQYRVSEIIEKLETDASMCDNPKLKKVARKLKEIKSLLNIMNMDNPRFQYCHPERVQEELMDAGYKVVKVPGRIFDYANDYDGLYPRHILNFLNGIVHINKDNELVYITNKSNLNKYCGITASIAKKIGFDFESEFINSVKDYIKPENIYFVDTKRFLKTYQGGIHCLCAEIPKFERNA